MNPTHYWWLTYFILKESSCNPSTARMSSMGITHSAFSAETHRLHHRYHIHILCWNTQTVPQYHTQQTAPWVSHTVPSPLKQTDCTIDITYTFSAVTHRLRHRYHTQQTAPWASHTTDCNMGITHNRLHHGYHTQQTAPWVSHTMPLITLLHTKLWGIAANLRGCISVSRALGRHARSSKGFFSQSPFGADFLTGVSVHPRVQ